MKKIRKAVVAFGTTAVGVVFGGIVSKGMPADATAWGELIGAAVVAGFLAAAAVWRVPNSPALPASADDAAVRRSYR